MSEDNKVSTYQFVAEPFHVDFMEKLTMGVLGNHLLNCAGFHAAERGFGIATLNENHYTWVLSRLAVEMEEMPRAYEKFSIQTWVENVYRLFTDRNFAILDKDGKIKSTMIIPTGGGAMMSAEKSLEMAVEKAGIRKEDIVRIVTTGYGRAYIDSGDDSITEITCHAKGAHYLNPNVRTVIDIGGQDIKAISIDENGAVKNFLMNDKCAAGTGRFLEMMARTLGLSLEEMSTKGLEWKENIVISSMCTVFAESEVVSLVAQNKDVADIIHGLNVSVASKVGALAARLGQNNPGEYMMTGGVAKNPGIVHALEEKLGAKLYICEESQLCGALGAAIFAFEKCKGE